MRRLTSIGYSDSAFNFALLLLRLGSGALMIPHGYDKLINYNSKAPKFMSFLGMDGHITLALVIFAEFLCAALIIFGLFTRLASIPLIINMSVALAVSHHWDVLNTGEKATLFLVIFIAILFVGPGKISVDGMMKK